MERQLWVMRPPHYDAAVYLSKAFLCLCRARGCSSRFSHPISVCSPTLQQTYTDKTRQTSQRADACSTFRPAAKQTNNKTQNSQYLRLHQSHSESLSKSHTHTVSVFTHPYNQTCLFTLCSALAGLRQDKESFLGARHFWKSLSSAVNLEKEAHSMLIPLETAGFSPALAIVSHTLWCVHLCVHTHTQHILSQSIRKPLTRPMWCTQVLVGGGRFSGFMEKSVCLLLLGGLWACHCNLCNYICCIFTDLYVD